MVLRVHRLIHLQAIPTQECIELVQTLLVLPLEEHDADATADHLQLMSCIESQLDA